MVFYIINSNSLSWGMCMKALVLLQQMEEYRNIFSRVIRILILLVKWENRSALLNPAGLLEVLHRFPMNKVQVNIWWPFYYRFISPNHQEKFPRCTANYL